MTRSRWAGRGPTLLLLLACSAWGARGPADVGSMNSFATEYNRYVEELRAGVVDLKQWGRVEKAWEAVK